MIHHLQSTKLLTFHQNTEVATEGVLQEKVLLEIWQNSQESTSARISFFNKVAGPGLQPY